MKIILLLLLISTPALSQDIALYNDLAKPKADPIKRYTWTLYQSKNRLVPIVCKGKNECTAMPEALFHQWVGWSRILDALK